MGHPVPQRCLAIPAVNYICSRRDGMSRGDAFREAYMFFLIKLVPNLVRRIKGVPSDIRVAIQLDFLTAQSWVTKPKVG